MRYIIKILSFFHPALKFVICCFCFLLLIGNYSLLIENGNWYQQFMPNLNGRQIVDITFTDSLKGYAITSRLSDTSYILKTTDGGDNWTVKYTASGFIFKRVQFINQTTGFVAGTDLIKTTNGGENWTLVYASLFAEDIYFINDSTAWYVDPNGLVGGVYFTSNGGASWTRQLDLGSLNPEKIYMFNARIGFITRDAANASYTRKTTDSGQTWFVLSSGTGEYFYDMYFADSLTGWGAYFNVRKTTDGGLNWTAQVLPYGGNIITTGVYQFSKISRDTIYAVGGTILTPTGIRGMIYRTINGGDNWLFQIPDTAIHIGTYLYVDFRTTKLGWAYSISPTGVHTTSGGDSVWLLGIKQISNEIPKDFKLYQNYPNPFNPKTIINYELRITGNVNLSVYDIQGKHIIDLVNQKQNPGKYEVDFSGNGYSSGVYFYNLTVTNGKEVFTETKKMILIK